MSRREKYGAFQKLLTSTLLINWHLSFTENSRTCDHLSIYIYLEHLKGNCLTFIDEFYTDLI